jgi:RHS repeat-associated protein
VSADGKTHSYTYDLLGRLSGTSLNTTTPYTTALTYKTNPSTGSSSHVLNSYRSGSTTTTYQVDANGNITQLSDGTHTYTYVYDDFNQLKRENNPWLNKSITYDYDLGGNLEEVNEYAYTPDGDLMNPTSTVVYAYDDTWKDQLTKIGNDDLAYDTNGNLLSYKTRSYSWQAGRQLAQITDTNLNALYTYNESGIRTRKVVNGVTTDYLLEGGKVILETTGNDALHYSYDSRGQLVSLKLNGTPYFYMRNGQGDITGLIDASGAEVVRYTYDSWGKPISITGSLALTVGAKNPYRYRGYRYDTESGLYYLQSRYYDPSIKRFISADTHDILLTSPYEFTDKNLFAYVDNNPIMRSDADGEYWFLIGAGVGLGVGFTASVMSQYLTTGTVNWNVAFVNGAAGAISGAIASTGIDLAASVGWNAVIGGATYAAEQTVKGEEIAIDGVINSTFAGGFGGAVGGKGMNAKALAGAWGNAQKQITREMRRASVKYATKRIAVHTATKVSIKSVVIVSLARFTGGVFTYTGIRLAIGD